MAYRVEWSPAALDDVDAIAVYIGRDSSHYAATVVRKLIERARQLTDFPLSGREVPELQDQSIRQLVVYSYRIVYRVQTGTVTIAAIVHSTQSFEVGVGRISSPRA